MYVSLSLHILLHISLQVSLHISFEAFIHDVKSKNKQRSLILNFHLFLALRNTSLIVRHFNIFILVILSGVNSFCNSFCKNSNEYLLIVSCVFMTFCILIYFSKTNDDVFEEKTRNLRMWNASILTWIVFRFFSHRVAIVYIFDARRILLLRNREKIEFIIDEIDFVSW